MANNDREFFGGGNNSQEDEVRDLFNLLMENEAQDSVSAKQQSAAVPVVKASRAKAEKPAVATALHDEETAVASVVPENVGNGIPQTEDPDEVFIPSLISPTPYVMQYEEDDMPQELPHLILTAQYEEDDDAEDQFASVENFVLTHDGEDDEEKHKEFPRIYRNPFKAIWHALCDNVPLLDDGAGQILRKSIFWLSIVLVTGALTYILYNVWWLPAFTEKLYDDAARNYHPEHTQAVGENGDFPAGMSASFRTLYEMNNEVRGWLSYHTDSEQDFLDIDYPIMYSGDNDKYLTVDFNGNSNKNGALFFDMRAKLDTAQDTNTSLIVYGHNMASGQMLAGLNKFIGNVNNARVAPTLTMNTLFDQGQYKVFAVVLTDEDAQGYQYFNIRRTKFADDEDFMQYVDQLCDRSLFDYPVDVQPGDKLLLLSTCTAPSSAKIDNGRLTVVARKVRANEIATMNTAAIVKNDDVIMPYAWYTRQNKQPHATYISGATVTSDVTTTTTTAELSQDGATEEGEDATSTSESEQASSTSTTGTTTGTTASTTDSTASTTDTTTVATDSTTLISDAATTAGTTTEETTAALAE